MLSWLLAKLFSAATLAKALSQKHNVMSVNLVTDRDLINMENYEECK